MSYKELGKRSGVSAFWQTSGAVVGNLAVRNLNPTASAVVPTVAGFAQVAAGTFAISFVLTAVTNTVLTNILHYCAQNTEYFKDCYDKQGSGDNQKIEFNSKRFAVDHRNINAMLGVANVCLDVAVAAAAATTVAFALALPAMKLIAVNTIATLVVDVLLIAYSEMREQYAKNKGTDGSSARHSSGPETTQSST